MKNYLLIILAFLTVAACDNKGGLEKEKLDVIPLGVAFENQTQLKVSDCFKKIRYVSLETNDNCLVGKTPYATILNDWIIVSSGQDRCQLFDKQTGRFIRSIGHVGDDPEAYASSNGDWQNPYTGQLYFPGRQNKKVVYRADGHFDHIWTPPIPVGQFPAISAFDYFDADKIAGYYPAANSQPARIALFRGEETLRIDTLLSLQEGDGTVTPSDIMSITVFTNGGNGMIIMKYKDNKSAIYPTGNNCFWHAGDNLYFHQDYNDTIYQVSETEGLKPVRVLDLGAYNWPYSERFEDKQETIYPKKFMENEDIILFQFITNVFNDKQKTFNALYRKTDGTVKVWPIDEKITDDLNCFLPVQPLSVSASGEYVALFAADEVAAWFEENEGRTDIPSDVATLKKVGEEDNPVVVILE